MPPAILLEEIPISERASNVVSDTRQAIADVLDLGFYAVDLIRNDRGLHILEVNPNPICYFYNQCNGRDDFVSIYRRLLEKYVTG